MATLFVSSEVEIRELTESEFCMSSVVRYLALSKVSICARLAFSAHILVRASIDFDFLTNTDK